MVMKIFQMMIYDDDDFMLMTMIIILQWKVVEMTPVVERDRVEELREVKDEVENVEMMIISIIRIKAEGGQI